MNSPKVTQRHRRLLDLIQGWYMRAGAPPFEALSVMTERSADENVHPVSLKEIEQILSGYTVGNWGSVSSISRVLLRSVAPTQSQVGGYLQALESLWLDASQFASRSQTVLEETSADPAPRSLRAMLDVTDPLFPPNTASSITLGAPGLREGEALLVVMRGSFAGSYFLIDSDRTTIGRHPSMDVFTGDDVTVSRHHCTILRENNVLSIVDNNSTHGTFVDQSEVLSDTPLTDGSVIQVGGTRFIFVSEETSLKALRDDARRSVVKDSTDPEIYGR